ncbi:MAG: PAS domain S-box protein [Anaerolineae bacterium]|nr:PAS domain S-box protein [Anaerolineae bacterium]
MVLDTVPANATNSVRILIVEDDYLIIRSLQWLLQVAGYEVAGVAVSGTEAIEQAALLYPDLILMDIRLKGDMDGIETVARIQERQDVPVIYLTGQADEDTLQRAKITAPFGYLLKPVGSDELHRAIEIALHKHALEGQLKESERRYRALFEGIPIGLYQTTVAGEILNVNPALVAMLGYPDRASLLAQHVRDIYVDFDVRQYWQAILEANRIVYGFDVQWRRYDGSVIWVRETSHVICDAEGRIIGYEGSVEDITARRQAEETQSLLAAIVASSDDAIIGKALDGTIRSWNVGAERIYGYRAEDVIGQSITILLPPDRIGEVDEILDKIARGEHIDHFETERITKDRRRIFISLTVSPIQDSTGKVSGASVIARDITRRRATAIALQQERDFAESLIDTAQTIILVLDLQGRIVRFNPYMEDLSGYRLEEVQGKDWFDAFLPGNNHVHIRALFQNAIINIQTRGNVNPIICKDGSERLIEWYDRTLKDTTGRVTGLLAIGQDVTERYHAAEVLRRSEERYRWMFQAASVSLWEQDISELRAALSDLRQQGVTNMRVYLALHPEFVREAVSLIKVVDVNHRTLDLYEAQSKEELLGALDKISVMEALPHFQEEILAIAGQARHFEIESSARTLRGKVLDVLVKITIPGMDSGTDSMLVSITNITAQKNAERALQKAHAELEQRVADRTAALEASNRQLQHEISERELAEQTLRRYAEEQAALYAVASVASSYLELEPLLEAALEQVLATLHADAGWIVLPSSTLQRLPRMAIWRGVSEQFGECIMEQAMRADSVCAALCMGNLQASPSLITCCPYWSHDELVKANLHSYVGIPLSVGYRVLGVMDVAWQSPDITFEHEDSLLITIGRQVGLALQNAQLYQAARQLDRLETVNAIGTAVVSSLEQDTVLHQVLELTCHALDVEEGSILLLDEATETLYFVQTLSRIDAELRMHRLALGQGIAGWVAQQREVACVNDVRADSRWLQEIDKDTGFETRSLLCAPLVYRHKVIGVIEMVNKRHGGFVDEDVSLLEAIASIAAVALENARLFADARAHAQESRTLYELGLTLSYSLDPTLVIREALSQVQALFQAQGVVLMRNDAANGTLHVVHTLFEHEMTDFPISLVPDDIAEWSLSQRQALRIDDIQNDHQMHLGTSFLPKNVRAVMSVPLLRLDHVIGVIVVTHDQPHAYTDNSLQTLQAIAATLAITLENAHLYDELKQTLREREAAQAQLIQAEKMSALGRLAASIAHEINNPLQAVLGCMMLSQEELYGQMRREKLERHLAVAVAEVKRVSDIVHRMHDFYRQARSKLQFTDVNEVLDSVITLSSKQLQHSKVQVVCDYMEELPVIESNPDHLKQVFLNMVLNAIDAMPEGGVLQIRTVIKHSPKLFPDPIVYIVFQDTGVGMSPEVQAHLFEPFFTTKEHGSGLGLSISYGIVEAHNGKILVESQEGKGATFTVLLPLTQPK